jgi:23S rRNA pseudouridine2457 synthase
MLIAFHKPFRVLSCFTPDGSANRTLAEFGFPRDVYPIGRLDADSEGLLLLSDEPQWNQRLLTPEQRHPRTYFIQVEGIPDEPALQSLRDGIVVQNQRTLPCEAWRLPASPPLPPRDPPIRFRKSVPDCWIALTLTEGRNRQVRRMTAAVGYPALRLVRHAIGQLTLIDLGLAPGQWAELDAAGRSQVLKKPRI